MRWTTIDDGSQSRIATVPHGDRGGRRTDWEYTQRNRQTAYRAGQAAKQWANSQGQQAVKQVQQQTSQTLQQAMVPVWTEIKMVTGACALTMGCIVLHAGITWTRPIFNVLAHVPKPFSPLGGAAMLMSNTTGSGDDTPLKEGDRVGPYVVTSGYGDRKAPLPGASTFHRGVDLDTPEGTEIYAVSPGQIECHDEPDGYGIYFKADWGMGGHLSECYPGNKQPGELIGLTGNTGISTADHLDARQGQPPNFQVPTHGFVSAMLGLGPKSDAPGDWPSAKIQTAMTYYQSQGLTHTASAYLVGSMVQESNLDPTAAGDGGQALGLNQWWPDRRNGMPSTFEGQLAYALREMGTDTASNILPTLQTSSDPTTIKAAIKQWTRWGHEGDRWAYAQRIISEFPAPTVPRPRTNNSLTNDLLFRHQQRI